MDRQTSKGSEPARSVASLVFYCALLAGLITAIACAVGWYAHTRSGSVGILAAALAGLICFGSAATALVATYLGQQMQAPVQGILIAMLFRMGVPLGAGLILQQQGGPLAQAGIFSMILGLYLCSLVAETVLSLRLVPTAAAPLSKAA